MLIGLRGCRVQGGVCTGVGKFKDFLGCLVQWPLQVECLGVC